MHDGLFYRAAEGVYWTFSLFKEAKMNWDQIEGKWGQFKGQVKQKWGELTDDDLAQVAGSRDELLGTLQEKYGIAKEEAEKQVEEFEDACRC